MIEEAKMPKKDEPTNTKKAPEGPKVPERTIHDDNVERDTK